MRRLTWNTALIIAAYYAVPLHEDQPGWVRALRAVAVLAGVALVGWGVLREAERQATGGGRGLTANGLAVITVAGVVLFALADYGVAAWRAGEFAGLETRTDALYFAVATLATVGFGDVHPQGQLARALVLAQMAFNVVVLATAATLLARRLKADQARRRAR